MGVRRTDYIMLGVKLPYSFIPKDSDGDTPEEFRLYEDSVYGDDIKSHNGLTMVSDGMGGRYVFIGKVLQRADEEHCESFEPTNCTQCCSPEEFLKVETALLQHFKLDIQANIWVFSHHH